MKPLFIGLSPNTQAQDVCLSRRLLLSPGQWQRGAAIEKLEKAFEKYFQVPSAVSFASGRTAFWAILKALGLGQGDEVLLQAYTCVVVPNSILAAGARPVWVDINLETFNMDVGDLAAKITPRSRAILVQHTFGRAADLDKILSLAKKHKLLVIEDCAQSLGAECQGKQLGTFGEAGFFSFGRDKIISSVFGGLAIAKDKGIGKSLRELQTSLPFPARSWIWQQLRHPLAFSVIIPSYFWLGFGKSLHWFLQQTGLVSRAVFPKEKQGKLPPVLLARMANALAALALAQFKRIGEFSDHRLRIAQLYHRELQGLPISLPDSEQTCWLRYTIQTEKAKALINFARKRRVFLGDWYRQPIAPAGVDLKKVFYRPGSCPQAEKAGRMSVNLPTYPKMSLADAKRVVVVIKEFFQ